MESRNTDDSGNRLSLYSYTTNTSNIAYNDIKLKTLLTEYPNIRKRRKGILKKGAKKQNEGQDTGGRF